jgi:DnaK suppressor protein
MTKPLDRDAIESRLRHEREELLALDSASQDASQTVELDQSRMGRLSRMDAMQSQAMAIEVRRRRAIQITRINTALERLSGDSFGECVRCEEMIEDKRLEFDPTSLLCFDCANSNET